MKTATPDHALRRIAPAVKPADSGHRLSDAIQPPRRAMRSPRVWAVGAWIRSCLVAVLVCLWISSVAAQERSDTAKTGPVITVTVEGLVKKPGTYQFGEHANLLHALAEAGGIESNGVNTVVLTRAKSTGQPLTVMIRIDRVVVRPPELRDGDRIRITWLCIAAGSRLVTPQGPKLIEKLKVGDSVLVFDFDSKQARFGRIVGIRESSSSALLILNHRLTLTATHPVWTQNGWVEAGVLRAGVHQLMTPQGSESITDISTVDGLRPVFDITVEPTSCFFADDILVHNKW